VTADQQKRVEELFDRVMQVPSWQIQPPGVVAQLVQVSAFPDRYAQHETQARSWLGRIAGTPALPSKASASGPPATMAGCGADGIPHANVGHIPSGTLPAGYAIPEAATDVAGVPRRETTGQAPNVSKKMGAEMDSAGDQRASPDEQ